MTGAEPVESRSMDDRTTTATPWEDARPQLAAGDFFWLATSRPDSPPHVRPLLAVWAGDFPCFCTGPDTRKRRNLEADPACSLATETDEFHFVIEGVTGRVTDEPALRVVADEYAEKYGWEVEIRDGAFVADGAPTAGPPPYDVYEVVPETIFGFGLGESATSTRWRFAE